MQMKIKKQLDISGFEPLLRNGHPKCANPACPTIFYWLTGGKFFRFSAPHCESCDGKSKNQAAGEKKCAGGCVKHFWLCEPCCNVFTLTHKLSLGVVLTLLRTELPETEEVPAVHEMAAQ